MERFGGISFSNFNFFLNSLDFKDIFCAYWEPLKGMLANLNFAEVFRFSIWKLVSTAYMPFISLGDVAMKNRINLRLDALNFF